MSEVPLSFLPSTHAGRSFRARSLGPFAPLHAAALALKGAAFLGLYFLPSRTLHHSPHAHPLTLTPSLPSLIDTLGEESPRPPPRLRLQDSRVHVVLWRGLTTREDGSSRNRRRVVSHRVYFSIRRLHSWGRVSAPAASAAACLAMPERLQPSSMRKA